MSVPVRKLLSACVRTGLVAAVAVLPATASAGDQAGATTRLEERARICREPLLDKDGRPLPGNVGGKKAPDDRPLCPRDERAQAQASTASR